jgi:hypothetical protein
MIFDFLKEITGAHVYQICTTQCDSYNVKMSKIIITCNLLINQSKNYLHKWSNFIVKVHR